MKKFLLIFKSIPWILVVSVSIVVGSLGASRIQILM